MSKSGHISFPNIDILDPDPSLWTKTSLLQLGYGIWVNLTLLNIGLNLEFSAVALPQLKKEDSKIVLTRNQEALIASILTVSSPIGCMLAGIIIDKCGRKAGLMWCHVPNTIAWIYIAIAGNANDIIMGRVIAGIGFGMYSAAPRAYMTEITLPNMRGVVGALPNLAISSGLTVQAILGSFLSWRTLSYLCGGYSLLLLCVNKFLPETPYYVLLKNTASAARITLQKFRSVNFNIDAELRTLEQFKETNDIRRLSMCETRKALFKSSACKPFGIIMSYIILAQFAGINVVTAWAVEMLQLANSSTDAHFGNVLLAITRMVVGLITAFLLYRVQRRPLAITSAAGVAFFGFSLGLYLHTHEGGRTPLILMISYVAFAVPGYYTLPVLMMFELFPLQIRGILSGVVLSTVLLLMSAVTHMFPIMRDTMGLANIFITYGSVSLFTSFLLYKILPETHDLTLQEIEEYFNKRRPTLVSERKLYSAQMQSQTLSSMKDLDKSDRSVTSTRTDKHKKKKPVKHGVSSNELAIYHEDSDNDVQDKKHSKLRLESITGDNDNDKDKNTPGTSKGE